jgi:gluconate:H+ symporter, GntP family
MSPLLLAAVAIVVLVTLIVRVRMHAFPALLIVSLGLGLGAGLEPAAVVAAFQQGVGNTLGFIAVVIGLGTFIGGLLAESGGAAVVARAAVRAVGDDWLPWAVATVGFVIGLPIFFAVGLVLLFPVVVGLAASSGRPLLTLALPLAAGLSTSHGLVAPHPGPLVAIERLGADTGLSILYGLIAGFPAFALGGPLFLRLVPPSLLTRGNALSTTAASTATTNAPGVAVTLSTVLLPIALMLGATLATTIARGTAPTGVAGTLMSAVVFLGTPAVALLVGTLVATYVFGTRRGLGVAELLAVAERALFPIASVLLIVGAGGGFGRVLDQAGIGGAITAAVSSLSLSPLVFAWLVAALLRIAVGSATVAITTAAAIVVPVLATAPGTNRELLVVALGAGSLIASHVNDSGFWLVKEYFGLDVPTMLKTWTVMETIISVVALSVVLALDAIL